ncbi:MAG: hypothetical protein AAF802_06875 [Planctomycetota bacterium]
MTIQLAGEITLSDGGGTLLWIGERDLEAFADAYDFCDAVVSQLAYRESMAEAIRRPASMVRTMLMCLEHDSPLHRAAFTNLCEQYAESKPLLLTGPLCAGARPSVEQQFGCKTIQWNEWRTQLPAYLRRCGWASQPEQRAHSIAIVASNADNARALFALAAVASVPVVWCRPERLGTVTGLAEYWWDDSATDPNTWETSLARVTNPDAKHVWIASGLTPIIRQQASSAGFDAVISKPNEFESLISRVERRDTSIRRAA